MTRYSVRYPKLRHLFAAYFHQDWTDDERIVGGSFEGVVRFFQTMNPAATVSQVTRELDEFIRLDLAEEELHDIVVDDLGANVHAPGLGLTYRQWLEAVLAILKQPASG